MHVESWVSYDSLNEMQVEIYWLRGSRKVFTSLIAKGMDLAVMSLVLLPFVNPLSSSNVE